ncbi:hypothetical protein FA13DRAFT_1795027 [Coprinellus micaceus]|uniref:Uncharacterized protein n=1 Tax=Coprinellus micaceus TaxID=71717 RepID=A0A4Y7SZC2_COPMI|nr:hypothetical protein FA13DRAFT_1795027 [Coprinellus micaceus]
MLVDRRREVPVRSGRTLSRLYLSGRLKTASTRCVARLNDGAAPPSTTSDPGVCTNRRGLYRRIFGLVYDRIPSRPAPHPFVIVFAQSLQPQPPGQPSTIDDCWSSQRPRVHPPPPSYHSARNRQRLSAPSALTFVSIHLASPSISKPQSSMIPTRPPLGTYKNIYIVPFLSIPPIPSDHPDRPPFDDLRTQHPQLGFHG